MLSQQCVRAAIHTCVQVAVLIDRINDLLAAGTAGTAEAIRPQLSGATKALFDYLPPAIRQQLMLDRDSHGNVQVPRPPQPRAID